MADGDDPFKTCTHLVHKPRQITHTGDGDGDGCNKTCQQMELVGLHMYAVLVHKLDDEYDPFARKFVVSLFTEHGSEQYGPDFSMADTKAVVRAMQNKTIAGGSDILWYVLELHRLFPEFTIPSSEILEHSERNPLPWMRYHEVDSDSNDISRRAAECAYRQQSFAFRVPLPEELKSKRIIRAATNVIDLYTEAMYLFRLKWLEGQDCLHEVTAYDLRVIPPREDEVSDNSDTDVSGTQVIPSVTM